MERACTKAVIENALAEETGLNDDTLSKNITSSADVSIHAAEHFLSLLVKLQQFLQTVNQDDLLKYFHQDSNSTAYQRRVLDLMIYGEALGAETRYDHLTGLLDRTSFLEKLKYILSKSFKKDNLTVIIFIDLDDFKVINDQYGHSAGDEVISIIGRRISASIRAQDLACRWGGDEFVLALQAITSKDLVSLLANRLLAAISQPLQLESKESLQLLVGASAGVAIMEDVSLSSMDLVERADKAMYLAKKAGKNSVEFYS
jgi:diguanylate cyclase (GGDEF)-like protein